MPFSQPCNDISPLPIFQVHKEKVDKVPNAIPGRNNIDIEIYGMEGIPEEDVEEHNKNKGGADKSGRVSVCAFHLVELSNDLYSRWVEIWFLNSVRQDAVY